MRDFKGMKRQRGRNRKPSSGGNANSANPNRSWDSQGPENMKVRGNAQTVYERYQQLARDAGSSGDRVLAENYLQHAEHYFRVLRALQPQRPVSEIAARELTNQGFDIDFEDETGAQAAAFLAAQQAADRVVQQGENRERDNNNGNQDRGQERNQDRPEGQQSREWRDRDQNRDRDNNQNRQNRDQPRDQPRDQNAPNRDRDDRPSRADADAPAEDGEIREGGRRETRRERWERRREERNRRFEGEGGQGETDGYVAEGGEETARPDAPAGTTQDSVADDVAASSPVEKPRAERAPRRTRATREPETSAGGGDEPMGLPSFLTRSSAPVTAAPVETVAGDAEVAAPKRRAPRRKAEVPADSTD